MIAGITASSRSSVAGGVSSGASTFFYTGVTQELIIGPTVTLLAFELWGAGGSGGSYPTDGATLHGGGGGFTKGGIAVSPGDVVRIQVGQGGRYAAAAGGAGGWPDGGGGAFGDTRGGGGGGSTRIWINGVLVAVAGGGGGSAGYGGDGGAGGGLVGGASSSPSTGGEGGSQIAGGRDASDTANAAKTGLQISSETNRTGGWGSSTADTTTFTGDDGGGGGGGYWGGGGGGGDGSAGGGGSGYISGSVTGGSTTTGSGYLPAGRTEAVYPGSPTAEGSLETAHGNDGFAWLNFNPAPENTVAPAITGNQDGSSDLVCSTGTWAFSPTSYTYQWYIDGVAIPFATTNTYTPDSGDIGHAFSCRVTASNSYGSASADSNSVTLNLGHRYWRVKTTAGPAFIAWSEVEFRETVGGADATDSGGTAIADSFYAPEGLVAANAFDNNINTKWACNGTGTASYIGWDFGAGVQKNISQVALRVRNDLSYTQYATAFNVDYSDNGSVWTTAWSEAGVSFGSAGQQQTFVP